MQTASEIPGFLPEKIGIYRLRDDDIDYHQGENGNGEHDPS